MVGLLLLLLGRMGRGLIVVRLVRRRRCIVVLLPVLLLLRRRLLLLRLHLPPSPLLVPRVAPDVHLLHARDDILIRGVPTSETTWPATTTALEGSELVDPRMVQRLGALVLCVEHAP